MRTALVANPFQTVEAGEPRSSGTEIASVREAQEAGSLAQGWAGWE